MRPVSALLRAQEHLRGLVASLRTTSDTRLPTTAGMARAAGVSLGTMHRAVRALREAGVLTTRVGAGIHVTTGSVGLPQPRAPDTPSAPAGSRSHRVARHIREELLSGTLDTLPSPWTVKSLASRYGVSRTTMRTVCARLLDERYLRRAGRGLEARPITRLSGSEVVFTVRGNLHDTRQLQSDRVPHFLRDLEQQCARRNVRLGVDVVPMERDMPPGPSPAHAVGGRAIGRVQGHLIWTSGFDGAWVLARTRVLVSRRIPVVIIDENALFDPDQSEALSRLANVRVLNVGATPASGEAMGRFLVRLGHRRVAYVRKRPASMWTGARQTGLASAFDAAGVPNAVTAAEIPDPTQDALAVAESLPSHLAPSLGKSRHSLAQVALRYNLENLKDALIREQLRQVLVPALGPLASEGDITCWVGENDATAIAALSFVNTHRNLRSRIDVAGFDNSPSASYNKLTSYDFNYPAIAATALSFMLGGRRTIGRAFGRATFREVEGFVVARESCR